MSALSGYVIFFKNGATATASRDSFRRMLKNPMLRSRILRARKIGG